MNPHHALPTFRLDAGVQLAQTAPWTLNPVTRESPALSVMTDLTTVKAATIAPASSLHQAEQQMIYQGVRMLFVVTDMPAIAGLITATDLRGAKPMQVVHERGLRYDELTVADVMTGLDRLEAVAYERLHSATVGDVVATLKRFGHQHVLVVEEPGAGTPRRVRGLYSRTQIERQLGETIEITPIASSFSEIEQALS
ncbi:MAG: CBS domain-containing protein [Burkholderiales bacterium]|nr:CBS domain-containing protein [Burkholderiales bacterium]MDE2276549.1 CBS domain-containing protein [Burkholderiales bacterium]